ncbi:MAG: hypothetical protein ABR911_12740 [Syntrophales bacterium]
MNIKQRIHAFLSQTPKSVFDFVWFLALLTFIAFIYFAWPLSIWCCVLTSVWLFARKKSNPAAKTLKDVSLPVVIGTAAVCLALFILNVLKYRLDPQNIRALEIFLIDARMYLRGLIISKTWFLITAIVVLSITEILLCRRKLLIGFLRFQKSLSFIILILTGMLTFTFFSQIPMESLAQKEHQRILDRYQVLLRQQMNSVAEFLAVKSVDNTISSMTTREKSKIIIVCKEICENSKWIEVPESPQEKLLRSFRNGTALSTWGNEQTKNYRKRLTEEESRAVRDDIVEQYHTAVIAKASTLKVVNEYQADYTEKVDYYRLDESLQKMPVSSKDWEAFKQNVNEQEERSMHTDAILKEAWKNLEKTITGSLVNSIVNKIQITGTDYSGLEELANILIKKSVSSLVDLARESVMRSGKNGADVRKKSSESLKTTEVLLLPSKVVKPFIIDFAPIDQDSKKEIMRPVNKSKILESSIRQGKEAYKKELANDEEYKKRFREQIEEQSRRLPDGEKMKERTLERTLRRGFHK